MELRRPTLGELDQVVELDRRGFADEAYTFMTLRQFYDAAGDLLVVAVEGATVIGYCLGLRASAPDEGWLVSIVVDDDHRLSGVGRALVDHTVEAFRKLGISRLSCTVDPKNHAVRPILARLGFCDTALIEDYFGPGEDRWVLEGVIAQGAEEGTASYL